MQLPGVLVTNNVGGYRCTCSIIIKFHAPPAATLFPAYKIYQFIGRMIRKQTTDTPH